MKQYIAGNSPVRLVRFVAWRNEKLIRIYLLKAILFLNGNMEGIPETISILAKYGAQRLHTTHASLKEETSFYV